MSRPSYRSMYTSFHDDGDVQRLSDRAYRVLMTLKGTLPATGIGIVFEDQLARRCNSTEGEVRAALKELEQAKPGRDFGWIVIERSVVWVVNGLRFEPNLVAANTKHRKFVAESLAQISALDPSLQVVRLFREHYPEWVCDTQSDTQSDTPPKGPSDTHSESLSLKQKQKLNPKQRADAPVGRVDADAERTVDEPQSSTSSYVTRCVVALNLGMQANTNVRGFREVSTSAQLSQVTWEADGIDLSTAERVIREVAKAFRPKTPNDRISGLKYFDGPVRARWKEIVDAGLAGPRPARGPDEPVPSTPERDAFLRKQGYYIPRVQ